MWYKIRDNQISFNIIAKPNAKKTSLVEISEQGLHILLHAKPHQDEANKELIAYLATLFKMPKSQIILARGEKSRHKLVVVPLTETIKQFLTESTKFKSK